LRHAPILSLSVLVLIPTLATAENPPPPAKHTEQRVECANRQSLRRPLFGETHAHTSYSFDAVSLNTKNPPSDAYKYAKGQPIQITNPQGEQTRCAQLARPLDWAALTDHSEFFGELTMCGTPAAPGHDSETCQKFRANPGDIARYQVRTADGRMMPLSNVVSVREATAPQKINHYNLFRSAEINGSAAPGYSSGQALQIMARLSDRILPQGMSYSWSGLSLEEIKAGSQSAMIFGLGLLLVYLTLAAQYESLTLPFIILLSVPLAIMGALLAQWGRGLINDVYCQIWIVMLIGLSAKNGILVVEFAEQLRARGMTIADAAVEAARIRLRPILMTSLAFILGVMPLVVASGAGREARHSVGTAVVGGMIASTFLNLAFIPVLYVVVKSLTERKKHA